MLNFHGDIGGQYPRPIHNGLGNVHDTKKAAEKIVQTLREIPNSLDDAAVSRVLDDLLVDLLPENVLSLLDKPLQDELVVAPDPPVGLDADGGVEISSYLMARKAVADIRNAIDQAVEEINPAPEVRTNHEGLLPVKDVEEAGQIAAGIRQSLLNASQGGDSNSAEEVLDVVAGDGQSLGRYDLDWMA